METSIKKGKNIMNRINRFRGMPWRVYAARNILHFFIGHIPVFQREEKIQDRNETEKVYKCYWCEAELKRGMWEFLYDKDGKAQS